MMEDRKKIVRDWRNGRRLPVAVLRELIDYSPDTGRMVWRPRGAEWFEHEAHAVNWNKRHAGRPALQGSGKAKSGSLSGKIFDRVMTAGAAAYAIHHGEYAPDLVCCENGDRSDLRADNLIAMTVAERNEMWPKPVPERDLPTGVYVSPNGQYQARLNGRYLGYYKDAETAAAVVEGARVAAEALK